MSLSARNEPEVETVSLSSAVYCLDCEVISNCRGDECPACKSHSLLGLERVLGGILHKDKAQVGAKSGLFNITLTVELIQMRANELNAVIENVTNAIGPKLVEGIASFHISVQTTSDDSFPLAA